jgi:hypothetical protein
MLRKFARWRSARIPDPARQAPSAATRRRCPLKIPANFRFLLTVCPNELEMLSRGDMVATRAVNWSVEAELLATKSLIVLVSAAGIESAFDLSPGTSKLRTRVRDRQRKAPTRR